MRFIYISAPFSNLLRLSLILPPLFSFPVSLPVFSLLKVRIQTIECIHALFVVNPISVNVSTPAVLFVCLLLLLMGCVAVVGCFSCVCCCCCCCCCCFSSSFVPSLLPCSSFIVSDMTTEADWALYINKQQQQETKDSSSSCSVTSPLTKNPKKQQQQQQNNNKTTTTTIK